MNIQIFIATHNRADLLPQSIDSLLRQTVKPEEIVILDNESTDNTKEVVSRYKECRYIKTTGFMGNFYKTYEIADKDYLMLFHDDDLLHPQYLEFAQSLIEKYKPALITTRYTRFNDNNLPILPKEINRDFYLFDNQKDLVRYMIGVEGVAYAPAIYRRDCFLKEDIEYYKYGKFNDWPFMAKMGFHGKTIITADENIFYARIHSGQDTRNNNTCISGQQIINWDKFFYQILGGDPLTSKSYHFLKSKYLQFTTEEFKKSCSIEELLNKFLEQCPNINSVYNRKLLLRLKHKIAVEKLHNKI